MCCVVVCCAVLRRFVSCFDSLCCDVLCFVVLLC